MSIAVLLPDIMTWDNGRELRSFTKDNVTTTYNYDSNEMRVRKNGADGKTQYYYNNDNMLVGTHFDNNTPSNKNDDTVVQFYYDTEGSPISFRVNGSDLYFYVKNLQGDIEKIIEPNGAVKVTYTYDAWGNMTSVTDNSTDNLSTLNPFRYRGYVYDTESGLYYLESRYYDPQIGRFINMDVYTDTDTGTPLSTNMFVYCENNAIMYIDHNGEDAWLIQDTYAVGTMGHTSLIIEDSVGNLWYYYWGDDAKQLICMGKKTKVSNKALLKKINKFVKPYYTNKFATGKYDGIIKFKGDFTGTFYYLYSSVFHYTMLYGRPTSKKIIISPNKKYNLVTDNCVLTSVKVLLQGRGLTKKQRNLLKKLSNNPIPNDVYTRLKGVT